ncbi:MAG: hypothetical protein ACRECN_03695 [Methylocella sp.]
MAARLEQDTKQRAEEKTAPVVEKTGLPSLDQEIDEEFRVLKVKTLAALFEQELLLGEAPGAALWDKVVESLGRSAGVLEELAESTGEAIARIAAQGDRIDRLQADNRTMLDELLDGLKAWAIHRRSKLRDNRKQNGNFLRGKKLASS